MPLQILPASAASPTPPASSVEVTLGSEVEPWFTKALERIGKSHEHLESALQLQQCLAQALSTPDATWALTTLFLPETPESANPIFEAIVNYEFISVEAEIVHVKMDQCSEVAYKLTKPTIDALTKYHKDVHCVNARASTGDWADKERQCERLHEDFIHAIKMFRFYTDTSALEGLEEEGTSELMYPASEKAKETITALMKPLLPPQLPRFVEVLLRIQSSTILGKYGMPLRDSGGQQLCLAYYYLSSKPMDYPLVLKLAINLAVDLLCNLACYCFYYYLSRY
ncbi:hypothetical protein FPOAC2_14144 [Fusarium poae]|jgi:hypothetical protein|uniref:Uncharacterized protein n=1 Tax=Fusarium poae TaxID=36050 RepID=A0A1B8A586_FUSPO|nr:hypothetical protein FPOA_13581 [Fusarium poae]